MLGSSMSRAGRPWNEPPQEPETALLTAVAPSNESASGTSATRWGSVSRSCHDHTTSDSPCDGVDSEQEQKVELRSHHGRGVRVCDFALAMSDRELRVLLTESSRSPSHPSVGCAPGSSVPMTYRVARATTFQAVLAGSLPMTRVRRCQHDRRRHSRHSAGSVLLRRGRTFRSARALVRSRCRAPGFRRTERSAGSRRCAIRPRTDPARTR